MSECLLTSYLKGTQGLSVKDLVVLDLSQLTKTTPELAPPLKTTPLRQRATTDSSALLRCGSSVAIELELMARRLCVRDHDY
ncbi:hypothetical protein TNCV_586281 [Trichonephila clavipes]|nr:hypothetical protein TNCV_586281 [Trichonephila clavipes]